MDEADVTTQKRLRPAAVSQLSTVARTGNRDQEKGWETEFEAESGEQGLETTSLR